MDYTHLKHVHLSQSFNLNIHNFFPILPFFLAIEKRNTLSLPQKSSHFSPFLFITNKKGYNFFTTHHFALKSHNIYHIPSVHMCRYLWSHHTSHTQCIMAFCAFILLLIVPQTLAQTKSTNHVSPSFTKVGFTSKNAIDAYVILQYDIGAFYQTTDAFLDIYETTYANLPFPADSKTFASSPAVKLRQLITTISFQLQSNTIPNDYDNAYPPLWKKIQDVPRGTRGKRDTSRVPRSIATTFMKWTKNIAVIGQALTSMVSLYNVVKPGSRTINTKILEHENAIGNIIEFLDKFATYTNKTFLTISNNNKAHKIDYLRAQLDNILLTALYDTKNIYDSIFHLQSRRFPPYLMQTDSLQEAFAGLVKQASEAALVPLTSDFTVVYKSEVSSFYDKQTDLLNIIISVPFLDSKQLTLYKFLPQPSYLTDNIVMEVQSSFNYIAVSDDYSTVKVFTREQFQECHQFGDKFHCPKANIVHKQPSQVCLFNLLYLDYERIEQTCSVSVSRSKTIATQILATQFDLISPESTRISFQCKTISGKPYTYTRVVQGQVLISLNNTCYLASTYEFVFQYNPQILTNLGLITLPSSILDDSSIFKMLKSDIRTAKDEDMFSIIGESPSVPLTSVRTAIKTAKWHTFYMTIEIIQKVIVTISFMVFTFFFIKYFIISNSYLFKKIRNIFGQQKRPRDDDPMDISVNSAFLALD